jgi:hypothetical protein
VISDFFCVFRNKHTPVILVGGFKMLVRFFVLLLMAACSSKSFAGPKSSIDEMLALDGATEIEGNAEDMFSKLVGLFKQASLPDLNDFRGGHVGRCYSRFEPSKAMNAAILIKTKQKDDGPLGSGGFKMNSFWNRKMSYDYFDSMSTKDLESYAYNVRSEYYSLESLGHSYHMFISPTKSHSFLRLSGEYLIEIVGNYPLDFETSNLTCYYFIRAL